MRLCHVFVAAALLLAGAAVTARADTRCAVAPMDHPPLAHVAALVASGHPLRIVALGSSSTSGTGATAPERTYPAQLAALLVGGRPSVAADVVNSGVPGETIAMNMARLERDVLAHRPDLVIWQLSTNDVFRQIPREVYVAQARTGLRRLRAAGADVILMEPQYLESRAADRPYLEAVAAVRDLGAEFGAPVVARFDFMKVWLDEGRFSRAEMLSADGLHMTDASYRCLAEVVAGMVAPEAVTVRAAGG